MKSRGIKSITETKARRLMTWLVVLASFMFLSSNAWAQYTEAPALAEQVAAGALAPIEERLPENPMVVEPVERIGQYGGTWTMGILGLGDAGTLHKTFYEHLVRWSPDGTQLLANVAESFEINEDATAFTFYLREGMKWSDGHPFTADDIVFWYQDVFLNEEITPVKPAWMTITGEPGVVEKIDDYTVVFRFVAPHGLFIQQLAVPGGALPTIYPRHYLEPFHAEYNPEGIDALVQEAGADDWGSLFQSKAGYSERWNNKELPTLNAWMLTTAYGEGPRVVAERNPYYWKIDPEGNQLPYLDRVVFDIFEDVEVMVLRALAGDINMQDRHIATLSNKAVFFDNQERGDYRFFDAIPAFSNDVVIALNLAHEDPVKREIFQNKDFRIGLSHAINRQEIIDLVYVGQGEPYQAAPRPESPLYDEQFAKQYTEYDVELANEYLDRAGYAERDAEGFRLGPDGRRISFSVEFTPDFRTEWTGVMELVQAYWREVGIDMQLRSTARSLFYTRKAANEHDAGVWIDAGSLAVADVMLDPRWYFPFSHESIFAIPWAYWYQGDPRGEEPPELVQQQIALYRQLLATAGEEEQIALMNEILQIAADEFYVIGIVLPAEGYGIVKHEFRNVPAVMPNAWLFPQPAVTNPEQYFVEQQ